MISLKKPTPMPSYPSYPQLWAHHLFGIYLIPFTSFNYQWREKYLLGLVDAPLAQNISEKGPMHERVDIPGSVSKSIALGLAGFAPGIS